MKRQEDQGAKTNCLCRAQTPQGATMPNPGTGVLACLLALLFLLTLPHPVWAAPYEHVRDRDAIIAVIPEDGPPSFYRDKRTGEAAGFAVDITNEIARRAGFSVSYKFAGNWDAIRAMIQRGGADIGSGVTISAQREQYYAFSEPFDIFTISFFARVGRSGLKQNALVGVLRGSVAYELLRARQDLQLSIYDNFETGLFDLLAGKIDSFAGPFPVFWRLALDARVQDQITIIEKPIAEVKRAFGVRKDRAELVARLNKALSGFVGSAEYQKIYSKWYGKPRPYWAISKQNAGIVVVLTLALVVMAFWRHLSVLGLTRKLRDEIRERNNTEAALAESEKSYRLLFDQDPLPGWIYDTETYRFLLVNKAAQKHYGYTEKEFLSMSIKDITPAEDVDKLVNLSDDIKDRPSVSGLWRHRKKDGALIDVQIHSHPVSFSGRKSRRVIVHDVTERKRAEELQQQTADRILRQREILSWMTVSQALNEGHVPKATAEMTETVAIAFNIERVSVWLFNEDGTELVCVDLYEATPKKHSIGAVLFEQQFGSAFETLKSARYVAANEPLTDPRITGYVETYLKPLGITSMLNGAIISGDRILGVLCFEHVNQPHHWEQDEISFNYQLADQISMAVLNRERRKIEEALKGSEARYRGLFEAESDAIVLVDNKTGLILEANNAASLLYGYDHDELLAKKNSDLSATPEETQRITHGTAVNSGQIVSIPLRFHRKKDGTVFPVEITGRFFMQQEKSVHIAAIRDITDRKRAEEQIQRSLKEKEVLLKEIHHRVKNNMQVIYSLLNLQAKSIADTTIRGILEDARNRVNTMALIHQKLYQSEDLAHINFNEYLQSLVDGIADTYKRRDVIVSVEIEPLVLDVNVGIPCGLIVNELVSNSFKYAFPEGRKGMVKVGINRNSEGNYVLTIADNGIGFPEAVDFRNTPSLGLQLVNVLTGQINGSIELSKAEGATFRITFPGMN